LPKFTVRTAEESDIDTLVSQRCAMWKAIHPELGPVLPTYAKRYRPWVVGELRKKKLVGLLVVNSRGRPVAGGCIWLRPIQPSPRFPGRELPYLLSMYTEPRYRRKGLASMLVRHAVAWSKDHGYPRLELHASDQGRGVYANLGFKRTWEMRLDMRTNQNPRRIHQS
jgi:GNAT superfamily N-acetyltransferase